MTGYERWSQSWISVTPTYSQNQLENIILKDLSYETPMMETNKKSEKPIRRKLQTLIEKCKDK